VAGRTDAGVHARGQVAHVDIPVERWTRLPGRSDREPGQALVDRLAGVLPPDIVVHRATVAPQGFDARFSALSRRYAYRIADQAALRDPLTRPFVLWSRRPLDVEAMDRACAPLCGLHDFAAYCRPRPEATTIRDLRTLRWERPAAGPDTGLVVATVIADAFCHSMVRSLVGSAMAVGEGRKPVPWMKEVLDARDRGQAAAVVPAHGLTLEAVEYPPDEDLGKRAEAIRAKRSQEDVGC
jgi:tRNA pseudouridine38-40 synthase